MDRQLKERLIGAIVVVTLGVLIIPEFLSGPDETSTVSVDIDLPAASRPETRTYTFRLDEPAATPSAPVPAPVSVPSRPVIEEQEVETGTEQRLALVQALPAEADDDPPAEPAPPPSVQPSPQPLPVGVSATDGAQWVVQLGSFSSEENARRLAAQLELKGFKVFVTEYADAQQILHRVRVGPAGTREQAEMLARRLAVQGQNAKVVPQP